MFICYILSQNSKNRKAVCGNYLLISGANFRYFAIDLYIFWIPVSIIALLAHDHGQIISKCGSTYNFFALLTYSRIDQNRRQCSPEQAIRTQTSPNSELCVGIVGCQNNQRPAMALVFAIECQQCEGNNSCYQKECEKKADNQFCNMQKHRTPPLAHTMRVWAERCTCQ